VSADVPTEKPTPDPGDPPSTTTDAAEPDVDAALPVQRTATTTGR
jgi:hypothetical protein